MSSVTVSFYLPSGTRLEVECETEEAADELVAMLPESANWTIYIAD